MVPLKGALQKLQHLAVRLMSSKHDRRLAKSGSAIMNKSLWTQNPLLLVRALKYEVQFSESNFDAVRQDENMLCCQQRATTGKTTWVTSYFKPPFSIYKQYICN